MLTVTVVPKNRSRRPPRIRRVQLLHSAVPALSLLVFLCLLGYSGCAPSPDREESLAAIARWEDRRLADSDSLAQMMAVDDAHVRRAAVRAAGLIGRDDILPQLMDALSDRSATVREAAAFALGLVGNVQAVPALIEATQDEHRGLRLAALEGLAHLDHDGEAFVAPALHGDTKEAIRAWNGLRNTAETMDHETLVATIQAGLSRSEENVLWRVLRCAEKAPDSTLVAQLAPFALTADAQVRVHALRALSRQEGPRALAAVLASGEQKTRFSSHDESRVQVALLRALARLAPAALQTEEGETIATDAARITALLTAATHDPDPHVTHTALVAMANVVAEMELPPEAAERESLLPVWRIRLMQAAHGRLTDPTAAVRAAATTAYFALRGEGALPLFGPAMADSSAFVRAAALTALAELMPSLRNVHVLSAAFWADDTAKRVRTAAVTSAARIWERCHDSVALNPEDRQIIKLAVFDLLERAVLDADFAVAATAAPLLGRFPTGLTMEALLSAYENAEGEGRGDIRLSVLEGLAVMMQAFEEHGAMLDLGETLLPPDADSTTPGSLGATRAILHSAEEDSLLASMVKIGPDSMERAAALLENGFDSSDIRIRLKSREVAVETGLLQGHLIPSIASLKATLPAHVRQSDQPAVARPFSAPRVRCVTDRGEFVFTLDGTHAPNTVAAFLSLVRRGFYDDLTFHRVVPDFVIQGGDPRGDGWGGPGYTIRSEWSRSPYERGTVGIAHSGKDTGGSQFFVAHSAQPHLNGRYTIFGQVTRGMDVVDRVQPGDTFRISIAE